MAVVGFVVGYMLVVPLTCTATSAVPGGEGATVCQSILGPEYRSTGVSEPPTDFARLAGVIGAGLAATATVAGVVLAERRGKRRDLGRPTEPTDHT